MTKRFFLLTAAALAGLFLILAWPGPVAHSTPSTDASRGKGGGGVALGPLDELTPAGVDAINAQLAQNRVLLRAAGKLPLPQQTVQTQFAWPLRAANGLGGYGYHAISNFVDHNPAVPNHLLDYNGGDHTYDLSSGYNHGGTDIILWPHAWLRMELNQVEVIAAAPGVIVGRSDGNFDHNCSFAGTPANAVYVRHADDSVAWYLHLKSGSVTPKGIGASVVTGEYLGVVGSSGNSTWPHLHFEVRNPVNNSVIDPWAGPSNPTVSSSWWQSQPPYYDSAVNYISSSAAAPTSTPCPQTDTPNESIQFAPGQRIYFTAYYRDQRQGQLTTVQVVRPNGTVYATDDLDSDADYYSASYWYFWYDFSAAVPQGLWRFELTYLGHTYVHPFFIGGNRLSLPLIVR